MQHKLINLFWSAYLSDFIGTWLNFLSLGHKWATRWGINEPLIFLHSEAFMFCICFHIDLVVRTYRIKSYCINLEDNYNICEDSTTFCETCMCLHEMFTSYPKWKKTKLCVHLLSWYVHMAHFCPSCGSFLPHAPNLEAFFN